MNRKKLFEHVQLKAMTYSQFNEEMSKISRAMEILESDGNYYKRCRYKVSDTEFDKLVIEARAVITKAATNTLFIRQCLEALETTKTIKSLSEEDTKFLEKIVKNRLYGEKQHLCKCGEIAKFQRVENNTNVFLCECSREHRI